MNDKTTEALKLAEEALTLFKAGNAILTDGPDDSDINHAYSCFSNGLDVLPKALAAIREALAEPVKQEPVDLDVLVRNKKDFLVCDYEYIDGWNAALDAAEQHLNAAPVDAKAIRAEVLEEAAKVCESKEIPFDIDLWRNSTKKEMTAHTAIALAAAIRGLK